MLKRLYWFFRKKYIVNLHNGLDGGTFKTFYSLHKAVNCAVNNIRAPIPWIYISKWYKYAKVANGKWAEKWTTLYIKVPEDRHLNVWLTIDSEQK